MATVRVPVAALLQQQQPAPFPRRTVRRTRRRPQPRRNGQQTQFNQLSKAIQQLSKLVVDDKKKNQPKPQKYFLTRQPNESPSALIVLPSDKKDVRYNMGKESIAKMAAEAAKLIKAGAGSAVEVNGQLILTVAAAVPYQFHFAAPSRSSELLS